MRRPPQPAFATVWGSDEHRLGLDRGATDQQNHKDSKAYFGYLEYFFHVVDAKITLQNARSGSHYKLEFDSYRNRKTGFDLYKVSLWMTM